MKCINNKITVGIHMQKWCNTKLHINMFNQKSKEKKPIIILIYAKDL